MENLYENNIEDEFSKFLKFQKGKGDFEENRIKHRFLNKDYLVQLSRPAQQNVVIKIVHKGSGQAHLNVLLRYIQRDLATQKEEEKACIYNQDGEILSENDMLEKRQEWIKDFENWEYKITDFQEFKTYKEFLNSRYEELGFDKQEWSKIQNQWNRDFYSYKSNLRKRNKYEDNLKSQNFSQENIKNLLNIDDYNKARVRAGEIWHDANSSKTNIKEHRNYDLFKKYQEERNKAALQIASDIKGHYKFFKNENIKLDELAADILYAKGEVSRKEAISQKDNYAENNLKPIIENLDKTDKFLSKQEAVSLSRAKLKMDKSDLEIWTDFEKNKYKELGIDKEKWDQLRTNWKAESRKSISEIADLEKEGVIQFGIAKDYLNSKYYDQGLSEIEGKIFKATKIYDRTLKPEAEIKEFSYIYDQETQNYGFYSQNKQGHDKIYALDKEGGFIEKTVNIDNLINVSHSMKGAVQSKPKDFSHIVLSVGGDNPNPELARQATQSFLEENLASKGFDYVYAMHKDTGNLHFHVILNNTSKTFHKKDNEAQIRFRVNKFDLQVLREDYTKKLDELGIDRTATLKKDGKDYLDKAQQKIENAKYFDRDWYSYQLSEAENPNFDALKFRRNAMKQLTTLSKQLELKGYRDMAADILAEKEYYRNIQPEHIDKAMKSTMRVFERDESELGKTMSNSFVKRIGEPEDYIKDNEIKETIIKDYAEHINKTIKDLENIKTHELSSELIEQRGKALNYLESRKLELEDKKLELGIYNERDEGRYMEREKSQDY